MGLFAPGWPSRRPAGPAIDGLRLGVAFFRVLTIEMIWVLGILALTLYLLVSEIVRVGVAAMLIMVLLGPLALNIAVQASAAGSEGVNPARFA